MKSIIIGFCICANCGKKRYEWNTYFNCPYCGCKEYVKDNIEGKEIWESIEKR